ncbi:MAG: hypothetical protein EAZ30_16770 [Betaproteobacteria bacterium]|nr:MAG: hypothetical protein EAZ30_16770 [Betaproteobacteria bacterium]
MSKMMTSPFFRRYGVMIALILIALVCYAVGYKKGSTLAIILGVVFECFFWIKFIRGDRAKRSSGS